MSFSYSIATRRYRCAYSHASKLTNHTGVISLLQLKSTKNDARFLNPRRHTFSSSSAATNNAQSKNNNANHTPPLPIRIALVSSTTALATPSFPALGFLYALLRLTVSDATLRKSMESKWGTILSFTTWTILPTLYSGNVVSLLLPCALGNALIAGSLYGTLDLLCGGPTTNNTNMSKILSTPYITGSGIGATTGYIAPNYIYGPIYENLYGMENMSNSIQYIMSYPFVTEVSVATSAVAGLILHPLLYYPMHGIRGYNWRYFSGLTLGAITSLLFYVYHGLGKNDVGLPARMGSYIDPTNIDLVNSIIRYDNSTGHVGLYSLSSQQFIINDDTSLDNDDECILLKQQQQQYKIINDCNSYSKMGNNKVIFNDRTLAFVYNYWDTSIQDKYPESIVTIPTENELQNVQYSMMMNDVVVASILSSQGEGSKRSDSSGTEQTDSSNKDIVMKIVTSINSLNNDNSKKIQPASSFQQLDNVIIAIELLMTINEQQQQSSDREDEATNEMIQMKHSLERYIKQYYPQLTLYTCNEQYINESVESQLSIGKWKAPEYTKAYDRWKDVHEKERRRTWRNRSFVVVTGIFLSVAASILSSK